MKLHSKPLNSSSHIPPPLTTHPPQHTRSTQPGSRRQIFATAQAERAPTLRHSHLPSRRQLVIGGSSLPLLLSTFLLSNDRTQAVTITGRSQDVEDDQSPAVQLQAANEDYIQATNEENVPSEATEIIEDRGPKNDGSSKPTSKKAFIDVSINREPAGRIVVELNGDNTPAGAARFASLVSGTAGISYRRKEFVKIMPNYIQHGGLRSFGGDAEIAKSTGPSMAADELFSEWETYGKKFPAVKNVAGSLGIIIRDPLKPPPKVKLVARKGKLEIDEEEVGTDPNGTEFVITTKDSPELDASTLVIGKVQDGMDVVEKISRVKTVQENTSSPYFRVAKLIGDKRAVVAERGFNRPYSKIIITNCGLLDE